MNFNTIPPDKCPRCTECEGEEHHWAGYYVFREDAPDHPAATQGVEIWEVCKHCAAWRSVDDAEDCGFCGINLEGITEAVEIEGERFCSYSCAEKAAAQEGSFDDDDDETETRTLPGGVDLTLHGRSATARVARSAREARGLHQGERE